MLSGVKGSSEHNWSIGVYHREKPGRPRCYDCVASSSHARHLFAGYRCNVGQILQDAVVTGISHEEVVCSVEREAGGEIEGIGAERVNDIAVEFAHLAEDAISDGIA